MKKYWHALNLIPGLGPMNFSLIYKHFNDIEEIWEADMQSLLNCGIGFSLSKKIVKSRNKINIESEYLKLKENGIDLVSIESDEYPSLLKKIDSAPFVLYYKGKIPSKNDFLIAIVGSRKHSIYGEQVCKKLVKELISCGVKIVSGLAIGIDTIVHEQCVLKNHSNFAVLGSGLDRVYPAINEKLGNEIIKSGGLISEYPPGIRVMPQNFFARNRIISGLCFGVLVIEAGIRSGTFITANHALDQGRDVFAVPGKIDSKFSKGSNFLIKLGAKLVTNSKDILDEYDFFYKDNQESKKNIENLNNIQKKILEKIEFNSLNFDSLKKEIIIPTNELLANITELEINGLISYKEGIYKRMF